MAACIEAQRALTGGTLAAHLASHVQDCAACSVVARISRQMDPGGSPIVDAVREAWLSQGTLVAERFEIEHLAGAGGMGAVYRARDVRSEGSVALKILFGKGGADAGRFAREAGVLAELRHPGVVRYVAHGQTDRGELYLAMEWLEGEDVARRMRGPALAIVEALEIVERAAAGLGAAHARGIVHRDVKPHNLFLVGGSVGSVKVLDFGIARTATSERWTKTGMIIGTPGYMAPEQARGERELDARADVFALGCVLFEALTGRVAFPGSDALSVLLKVVLETPPRARTVREDVPDEVDDLLGRMLSKEPSDRPRDGTDAARKLAALRGGLSTSRRSVVPGSAAPALGDRERRVTCVLLAREPPPSGEASTAIFLDDRARADALREVLAGHGARLDLLADGSLAVTPARAGTAVDVAARLARCALAIRPLLSDSPLSLAAGSAEVSDGAPAGEVIDRGARLLVSAPPGVIRIDDATARLLGARFDVGQEGGVLALFGVHDADEPAVTLLGRQSPCVGRERELAALQAIFEECARDSVAHAVVVTGPAGVGKSRLRHELLARIASDDDRFETWIGRGDALTAGAPFGVLAGALRSAFGARPGDPLEARHAAIRARVERSVPPADRDRVCTFLAELVGAPLPDADRVELRAARQDPMLMGDQMRRAWEDWLAAESAARPILLVLEDLHWGDAPSAKFVESALKNLGDRPWMVIALGRSEADPRSALWAGQAVTRMELRPLPKKASEQLVRAALGPGAPAERIASIVERAAGNAYYLEELVRAAAAGSLEAAPESVLGMVQARLDSLSDAARRTLRAASVFGRSFRTDGVVALLGGERRAQGLTETIEELARQEIVVRTSAAPGAEAEHSFRHALVQEAAYAMLTDEDRLLGHRLAAIWMEGSGLAEPIALAEHFDRGAEKGQAAGWYRRAAEQALEGNDLESVLDRVDRARRCGATGSELGLAALAEAQANKWRGENERARRTATEAMALLASGSSPWFRAAGEKALATGLLGDHDALLAMIDELAAVEPDGPALPACVTAHVGVLMPLILAGRSADVGPLFARVESLLARSEALDPVSTARVQVARAWQALFAGDPGTYLFKSEAAAELFQRGGDLRNACTQKVNAGYAHMELGHWTAAERSLREALAVAERMSLSTLVAAAKHNLGLALARTGSVDAGRAVEAEALAAYSAQGDRRMEGSCKIYLALIAGDAGDMVAAERDARAAVEVLDGAPPARAQALAVLARALVDLGRADEARAAAVEAGELLESLGGIDEGEAIVRLALAEALDAAGDRGGSAAALGVARERLLSRAERIQDPSLRSSFLDHVPENARTLALAAR